MEDQSSEQTLTVFAIQEAGVTLRTIRDALQNAGFPASIGVEIAGDAIDAQLDDPQWTSAFARWHEPELHDVWLLSRDVVGVDEEANEAVSRAARFALSRAESADKLIVADHLSRTRVVYACQILPAMLDAELMGALAEEDHPAFGALDVALRALADPSEGLIYAQGEAFYDADGEPLLAEE